MGDLYRLRLGIAKNNGYALILVLIFVINYLSY